MVAFSSSFLFIRSRMETLHIECVDQELIRRKNLHPQAPFPVTFLAEVSQLAMDWPIQGVEGVPFRVNKVIFHCEEEKEEEESADCHAKKHFFPSVEIRER